LLHAPQRSSVGAAYHGRCKMDDRNPNQVTIAVRSPRWLADAIEKAAARDCLTRSSYIRGAVLKDLRAAGVKLETEPA
jgi:hypothetical protein